MKTPDNLFAKIAFVLAVVSAVWAAALINIHGHRLDLHDELLIQKMRTKPPTGPFTNLETWDDARIVTHWVTNVYWVTNPPVTIETTNIVVVGNRDPKQIAEVSNTLYGLSVYVDARGSVRPKTTFELLTEANRKLDQMFELTRYLHHQAKQQEDVRKTLGEPRHWSYPPYWTNGIPFIFSNGTMRIFQ